MPEEQPVIKMDFCVMRLSLHRGLPGDKWPRVATAIKRLLSIKIAQRCAYSPLYARIEAR
jgi:hypothetical protein